jgi:hypothetical protein
LSRPGCRILTGCYRASPLTVPCPCRHYGPISRHRHYVVSCPARALSSSCRVVPRLCFFRPCSYQPIVLVPNGHLKKTSAAIHKPLRSQLVDCYVWVDQFCDRAQGANGFYSCQPSHMTRVPHAFLSPFLYSSQRQVTREARQRVGGGRRCPHAPRLLLLSFLISI